MASRLVPVSLDDFARLTDGGRSLDPGQLCLLRAYPVFCSDDAITVTDAGKLLTLVLPEKFPRSQRDSVRRAIEKSESLPLVVTFDLEQLQIYRLVRIGPMVVRASDVDLADQFVFFKYSSQRSRQEVDCDCGAKFETRGPGLHSF